MINIKGLDKAELLVELYNNSFQQGIGQLQPLRSLSIEDAKELLKITTSFDYLYGKVMKVDLSSDEEFEEELYDMDNGQGKAQKIVDEMRNKLKDKAATSNIMDNKYIDFSTNINNKLMSEVMDTSIDITGSFIGYYESRELDDMGKEHKSIKIGLFEKSKVYNVDSNRLVQSYMDLLSGNTAGLLLSENGKDITISPEDVSPELVSYKPLSTDYSIDYYSSMMQKIETKYGVNAFTSKFVGDGLISWEENWKNSNIEEKHQEVPTSFTILEVLEQLDRFNNNRKQYNKYIANPIHQTSILKSIKDVPKKLANNLQLNNSNVSGLAGLSDDVNTIKQR